MHYTDRYVCSVSMIFLFSVFEMCWRGFSYSFLLQHCMITLIFMEKTFFIWSLCSFYRFHSLPCLLYWLSGLVYPFHLSFLDSSLDIESTLMTTQWEPIKFLVRCRSSRGICHQYQRKWLLFCLWTYYVGYRFKSIVCRCAKFKYFIIQLFNVYVFKVLLLF